jgi:hypothetical protein
MRLRAACTLNLWEETVHHRERFVDWFVKLVIESSQASTRKLAHSLAQRGRTLRPEGVERMSGKFSLARTSARGECSNTALCAAAL